MELTLTQQARLEASEAQSKARVARRHADELEALADKATRKADEYEELMELKEIMEAKGYFGSEEDYIEVLQTRSIHMLRVQIDLLEPNPDAEEGRE